MHKYSINNNVNNIETSKKYIKENKIFLFFDLLQIFKKIINITHKDNIIILVGNTPSYLQIFLEKYRRYYCLPFSDTPFNCFKLPIGELDDRLTKINEPLKCSVSPELDKLNNYFKYLNNKTFLTKKFVKTYWNKIILVDSSTGTSIYGASIFFNLYVGNIETKIIGNLCKYNNKIIDCTNIKGSNPLQFINLVSSHSKNFNITPNVAKKYIQSSDYNMNPNLIIQISQIQFLYCNIIIQTNYFPRGVPYYGFSLWGVNPDFTKEKHFERIEKEFKLLFNVYSNIHKKIEPKIKDKIIKILTHNCPKKLHKYLKYDLEKIFFNFEIIVYNNKQFKY